MTEMSDDRKVELRELLRKDIEETDKWIADMEEGPGCPYEELRDKEAKLISDLKGANAKRKALLKELEDIPADFVESNIPETATQK